MAKAMERDMRNKFFIALLLTIPTVLYSPMGMNILGLRLPTGSWNIMTIWRRYALSAVADRAEHR